MEKEDSNEFNNNEEYLYNYYYFSSQFPRMKKKIV